MVDENQAQVANDRTENPRVPEKDESLGDPRSSFRDRVEIGRAIVMGDEHGVILRTVVAGGGSVGPGTIRPITGYRAEGRPLKMATDLRSRSARSGAVEYRIPDDGLYRVQGVPLSNSSRTGALIEVRGGQVALLADEHDKSTDDAVLRERFPAEAAAADAEFDLTQRIEEERTTIEPETIDGFTVIPEWNERPIRNLPPRPDGMTEEEYVAHVASPAHYVVQSPVFAKASTAEECAKQARERYDEKKKREQRREDEHERARKAAEENSLPSLKGSDRQARWAMNIRQRYIDRNGIDRIARERKTARWWIDNYKNLTRD